MAQFSFKELDQVLIKTTYSMKIGKREFSPGETLLAFDKIQLGAFDEQKVFVNAHGGYGDRARVWWETTKEVALSLEQGVFSTQQFAFMDNARLWEKDTGNKVLIPCEELVESDESGVVRCSHIPIAPLFVYNVATGEAITDYTVIDEQTLQINQPYISILLDYSWEYDNGCYTMAVGDQLSNGTFVLTGRTRVKDDITGQVTTGILKIPKLKLMSALSIRLGPAMSPVVGAMRASAIPVGIKGHEVALELTILNDDIDSDM